MKQYPTIPESFMGAGLYPPTYEVQRHLVDFLRWRFSKLPVGAYHWNPENAESPDQSGSEVFITTENPISVAKVGARPAITLSRGPAQAQGYGLGNVLTVDLASGKQGKLDLLPSTVLVNVVSQVAVEAERLAFFCFQQIFAMREAVVRSLPCLLSIGSNMSLSPPMGAGTLIDPVGGTPKWHVVSVNVPVFLQVATSAEPLNRGVITGVSVKTT